MLHSYLSLLATHAGHELLKQKLLGAHSTMLRFVDLEFFVYKLMKGNASGKKLHGRIQGDGQGGAHRLQQHLPNQSFNLKDKQHESVGEKNS